MMSRRNYFLRLGTVGAAAAAGLAGMRGLFTAPAHAARAYEVTRPEAEWRQQLSAEQYRVLREAGTEWPFSSPLDKEKRAGTFRCAGCALPLFSSRTKFDSGTGWPSFWKPEPGAVDEHADNSMLMRRTEVLCHRCGGHLGHVFDDGPKPTGLRYCMNGAALNFTPA